MTYKEIINEDLSYKQYALLVCQLAISGQIPIRVYRYDNDKNSMFLIIKINQNTGNITSKKIVMPRADSIFFTSAIAQDFPSLEFERLTAKEFFNNGKEIDN